MRLRPGDANDEKWTNARRIAEERSWTGCAEVFVAVAEAGSFAASGVRLGMSPPAVTRAVAAVEDRLGTRPLNRTTRRPRMR
jgi:hypothetical protein